MDSSPNRSESNGEADHPDLLNIKLGTIPYMDGYPWQLKAGFFTKEMKGSAYVNFMSSVNLVAVLDSKGNELANDSLQFESGLRIREVPEPSGLLMLVIGMASLLFNRKSNPLT